jgi:hypothetical protein
MWANESSLQTEEKLQAQTTYQTPRVVTMWTMESKEECGQRLHDQATYQAKQRAPLFEQGKRDDLSNMDIIFHHCGA